MPARRGRLLKKGSGIAEGGRKGGNLSRRGVKPIIRKREALGQVSLGNWRWGREELHQERRDLGKRVSLERVVIEREDLLGNGIEGQPPWEGKIGYANHDFYSSTRQGDSISGVFRGRFLSRGSRQLVGFSTPKEEKEKELLLLSDRED